MTASTPKNPPQNDPKAKGGKTDRQNRLGSALRDNLRKRKAQISEREKSKASTDTEA